MNVIAYVRENLAGAWEVMLGRPDGAVRIDTSIEGFWRSFAVIVLVAPFALLSFLSEEPIAAEGAASSAATVSLPLFAVAVIIDWVTFPLIFAFVARAFALGSRYVPFIVARNWASVIVGAMIAVLDALHLLGIVPQTVMPFAVIGALAVALRFSYVIARTTLGVSMALALPIVLLDYVVSLTIWSLFRPLA
jgi:hypothetical protein